MDKVHWRIAQHSVIPALNIRHSYKDILIHLSIGKYMYSLDRVSTQMVHNPSHNKIYGIGNDKYTLANFLYTLRREIL